MIFIHSPRLTVLASGVLCFLAGIFGYRYGDEPGHWLWLSLFSLSLAVAAWMMMGLVRRLRPERETRGELSDTDSHHRQANEVISICESAGLSKSTIRVELSESKPDHGAPVIIQQSLDLDGMGAVRALEKITGHWLVCDASEHAVGIIRMACLETVEGGATELERTGRWFDIARCLRSRACRSLPKAELRRSFVAERVGVSKEQVRQIDQGRYAPLNRMLAELDPKSL